MQIKYAAEQRWLSISVTHQPHIDVNDLPPLSNRDGGHEAIRYAHHVTKEPIPAARFATVHPSVVPVGPGPSALLVDVDWFLPCAMRDCCLCPARRAMSREASVHRESSARNSISVSPTGAIGGKVAS